MNAYIIHTSRIVKKPIFHLQILSNLKKILFMSYIF